MQLSTFVALIFPGGQVEHFIRSYHYDHHHFLILINDNVDDDFSDANNVTGR